ncbi:hypothetical protein K439DRAFT_1642445 [Ramaria rubella]|nr:hypothetical protein K439DRAFT_1642445 [Ramaria rubella]
MRTPIELSPAKIQVFQCSGRWEATSSGSLVSSWCGASIRFLYCGQALCIRAGSLTERKDKYNGGTPMLACTVSNDLGEGDTVTYDIEALQTIPLYTGELGPNMPEDGTTHNRPRTIELVMIDWASVFELEAIITTCAEDIRSISEEPVSHALFIGDSVSCGFSDGSQPLPRGCLDAFPFLARDVLRKEMNTDISVDMVAFPGIRLVDPTEEDAEGIAKGMVSRFFHASPWSDAPYEGEEFQPTFVVLALGTNDDAEDVEPLRFQEALDSFINKLSTLYSTSLRHIVLIQPFPDFTDEETSMSGLAGLASRFPCFAKVLSGRLQHQQVSVFTYDIANLREEHTMDGLHPTVEGQSMLGKAWVEAFKGIVESSHKCPNPPLSFGLPT